MFRYRSWNLVSVLLVVPGCALIVGGCSNSPDEAAGIAEMVQESQRGGYERHDFEAYMAIWAEDAKIISARSSEPDKYDIEMTRSQIEDLARLKFRAPAPTDVKFQFDAVRVDLSGDEAILEYQVTVTTESTVDIGNEIYRLRKTSDGWKAYENRYWPLELRVDDQVIKYDATTRAERDDEVERTLKNNDRLALAFALMDARRYKECHTTAKQLTSESADDPEAWTLRGHAALSVGDAKDAETSFRRALDLDENAHVPDFIRAPTEN